MLSILVPIYNFDVTNFVNELYKQCVTLQIKFEILCYDDCSTTAFKAKNKSLIQLQQVTYLELPINKGRSKIRNLLANDATYDKLLFVDCDSKIESKNYIKTYLQHFTSNNVIYGGRSYSASPPTAEVLYLRWFYGTHREVKSSKDRATETYRNFMTNNFLIDKKIMLRIRFDETLRGYGYEDLLFAQELKESAIYIQHIDNPLQHIGLENATVFLEKTANGMKNLAQMIRTNKAKKDIKIYRIYSYLSFYKLTYGITFLYSLVKKPVTKNLLSKSPNLLFFDFFKLYHLINEIK